MSEVGRQTELRADRPDRAIAQAQNASLACVESALPSTNNCNVLREHFECEAGCGINPFLDGLPGYTGLLLAALLPPPLVIVAFHRGPMCADVFSGCKSGCNAVLLSILQSQKRTSLSSLLSAGLGLSHRTMEPCDMAAASALQAFEDYVRAPSAVPQGRMVCQA